MKALVKFAEGIDGLELREVNEPTPNEGELKVKVLAAGICGSDIHAYHDERYLEMPVILGHEFVGQVTEVCGDVGEFKVGDWVTTLPACYSCGTCELCKEGLVTLCKNRRSIGSWEDGAMADYVVVPAKYSFKLPDSARTLQQKKIYALAEPFCCIVRGVYERVDVKPGDVVVVSGPGPMGMMTSKLFKTRGAYVILSGLPADTEKLELAKTMFGADETVTSLEELKEAVYRKNPAGADITCDCAGVLSSLENCIEVVRVHGKHLEIANFGKPISINLDSLFFKEVDYVQTNSTAVSTWKIGMKLLEEGKVDLTPLMNLELPLAEWKEGFETAISRCKYKIVLLPDHTFET